MKIDGQSITLTISDIKKFWEPQMEASMAELNRSCPMVLNEYVKMSSVKFQNNTVYIDMKLDVLLSQLSSTDIKELKEQSGPSLLEGFREGLLQVDTSVMPRSEWIRLFKELDIKFYVRMLDKNGSLITSLTATTANM